MMTEERLKDEFYLLSQAFSVKQFKLTSNTLTIALQTNSKKIYTVRIDLAEHPYAVPKVFITSPKPMSTMKERLKGMLLQIPLILLFGGYILLVSQGTIWALIPAVFAILVVIVIMLDSAYKYRNIITVKLILWVSVVSITLLGIGLIAYDLTSGYIFSATMDIYPASYAANLLSLIFVSLPLIRIAEPFYKKYEPQLYIPMVKEDIEALEANKREKKEEDNNEKQQ